MEGSTKVRKRPSHIWTQQMTEARNISREKMDSHQWCWIIGYLHGEKLNYITNSCHHQIIENQKKLEIKVEIKDGQRSECKQRIFISPKENTEYIYNLRVDKFP